MIHYREPFEQLTKLVRESRCFECEDTKLSIQDGYWLITGIDSDGRISFYLCNECNKTCGHKWLTILLDVLTGNFFQKKILVKKIYMIIEPGSALYHQYYGRGKRTQGRVQGNIFHREWFQDRSSK